MTTVMAGKAEGGRSSADAGLDALSHWVAVNLLRGCVPGDLIAPLREAGLDRPAGERLIDDIQTSPIFAAVDQQRVRVERLEAVLAVRRSLERLATPRLSVPRRVGLSRSRFLNQFYARNLPVALADVATSWPALARWNMAYLSHVLGDVEVDVMAERADDSDWYQFPEGHATRMPFWKFAQYVEAGWSNELYLVANNHLLESPAAQLLFDDFSFDKRYLDPRNADGCVHLWCGPAGSITHLHHDTVNILFVQVAGRKVIKLAASVDGPLLHPQVLAGRPSVYSEIRDLDEADADRYPEIAELRVATVVLEPGDALFIPVAWWHQVKALAPSISLSFTNFVFPNTFPQLT
jgi:hypothetical protein